jgi:hypothetical protein
MEKMCRTLGWRWKRPHERWESLEGDRAKCRANQGQEFGRKARSVRHARPCRLRRPAAANGLPRARLTSIPDLFGYHAVSPRRRSIPWVPTLSGIFLVTVILSRKQHWLRGRRLVSSFFWPGIVILSCEPCPGPAFLFCTRPFSSSLLPIALRKDQPVASELTVDSQTACKWMPAF